MKILVIKVGALGDVVRTSFIAQALKNKYKKFNPEIYWVTSKIASPLFINNPYIKKVIVDSKDNFKSLRNQKFNLIISLEEERKYLDLVSSFNCKKIGFFLDGDKISCSNSTKDWYNMSLVGDNSIIDSNEFGKIQKNDFLKRTNEKKHRQLISEIIGLKNWKKYEPFLRLNKYQERKAREFRKRYNLNNEEMIIGLNLGGADRWPKALSINLSAKLIDLVYKKFNCKIILFGGPNEIERNQEIIAIANSPVIDAGTGNDLIDFPALLSTCNYIISTDTAGLHISLSLKKKTLALIGPTLKNEIETFGHGEVISAKSNCNGCLQKDCKSMNKISLTDIIQSLEKLSKTSIAIIITSFKEPKTGRAIESILKQKISKPFKIIVSAPDKETQDIVKEFSKKDKRVELFKDPGKGKSFALNQLIPTLNEDIFILTDGDVYLGKDSIQKIDNLFNNSTIGCITGRPIPEESRKTKYGYWANFLFEQAHLMRQKSFIKNNFLECSGYLFGFRNNIIKSFPLDTAEDTIIPYFFWEKGYKIGYVENAKVFVKNVSNWNDWINQKIRTSLAHENLDNYVDISITPRTKTFGNEAKGIFNLFSYSRNLKEFLWSTNLLFARLLMWSKVIFNYKLFKKKHSDSWERIESTK